MSGCGFVVVRQSGYPTTSMFGVVFVREGDSEDLGRKGKPRPPLNLLSWLSFLLPPCIHGMTRDLNHLNNLPMTSQALVCFPRNHMVF
ncbi:hypothetical protein LIER_31327 [Lithospermum erythrorhizon]|uniref:Uncharacterized protein n=1 Tax=Lithospermum erythrorhizon TaxID=34254 RepID=A0AAV3RSH0_LITER